ncbi:D-ala-D-ala dipeptidase family protein [Mycobacterium ulcerans str. Harvey]|uniref:D-ala-D-ala dipeptidase family protein n=1 Tax=Mycobacterium ulcerans str. Harvey TaxID=1299332 RepID=A0ABN0RAB5_MYCUL|nr:D-ala-D-ala dipeptidase family protein [Mycobacterium ulcerans str. Harvey]
MSSIADALHRGHCEGLAPPLPSSPAVSPPCVGCVDESRRVIDPIASGGHLGRASRRDNGQRAGRVRPPVSAAAAAAGLVDVRSVVPDAIIDLRYATTNNFTRTQLYPADARCLVHESMAPGLTAAAAALRRKGRRWCSGTATDRTMSRSRCSRWSRTRPGWRVRVNTPQPRGGPLG